MKYRYFHINGEKIFNDQIVYLDQVTRCHCIIIMRRRQFRKAAEYTHLGWALEIACAVHGTVINSVIKARQMIETVECDTGPSSFLKLGLSKIFDDA